MVPFVRLKKSYVMNGKRLGPGKVFRTSRNKLNRLIDEGIGEQYEGPIPPVKMKLNLKDL